MSKTDKNIHYLSLLFSLKHDNNTLAYQYAKDVLTWLFERPFSERLSDSEQKAIKKRFTQTMEVFCTTRDVEAKSHAMCKLNTLEYVFGKVFFEEEQHGEV